MKKRTKILLFFMLQFVCTYSQSVSTSPYSIYGLGSLYESDFGSVSAMGSTGIALPSSTFINNKNPASMAFIGPNSFFYDIGANAIWSTYEGKSTKEKKQNFQFSHIAFAFPINSKSGISVAMKPYSSASYIISDYKLKIDNSDESYSIDADSKGGLNTIEIAYGLKISKKIALGISPSVYFGSIEDNRTFSIATSITKINKNSNYQGFRFMLGSQYIVDSTFVLGLTLRTPTKINATKMQSISSINKTETEVVQDDIASDATNYYLPFEFGIGLNKLFKNNMSLSFDYEKSFWNMTNQSSIYGDYTNQDKLSVGLSYFNKNHKINFYNRLHYYLGINYDSGFLLINNQRINNTSFSVGLGIPLERTNSLLNISYSYGIKGKVSNDLIKENYQKIGVNLSFEAIWFVRRHYD